MIRVDMAIAVVWVLLLKLCPTVRASTDFTFESYVEKFGKVYATDEEKQTRKAIFEENLQEITERNSNNRAAKTGHFLEINEWADRRIPDELPLGLQKKTRGRSSLLEFWKATQSSEAEEFYQNWLKTKVVPVSDLPKEVDWRTHTPKVTTSVKDQGFCGSCWAVAATAVVESHIALQTGKLFTLSPQELVSCVANPEHCGGGGGCDGATYELAFEHVMEHGMVLETDFPYQSGAGADVQCTLENATSVARDEKAVEGLLRGTPTQAHVSHNDFIDGAVATITGYVNFPTNNYTVLMNAVATLGPIGVTVAASRWAFYGGGVFKLRNHNSSDATNINHAVVLEGFGVDQETQELYWLVRNSWGVGWGESGYIRLERVDPSALPDFDKDDCGMDNTPTDGAACTKDKDGNDIVPEPIKVCGTTGILYDTFVPVGGRILSKTDRTATALMESLMYIEEDLSQRLSKINTSTG